MVNDFIVGIQTKKNMQMLFGIIFSVTGLLWTLPSIAQERYFLAGSFSFVMIIGLVFLAFAFGD
jgi:hypothetical protein